MRGCVLFARESRERERESAQSHPLILIPAAGMTAGMTENMQDAAEPDYI
jgi:hypothetical protein